MTLSEVFNIDCLEGMKQYPDKHFDLALVDPPYGVGETWRTNKNAIIYRIPWNGFIEIDKDYFEAQETRFKQFTSQTKLPLCQ